MKSPFALGMVLALFSSAACNQAPAQSPPSPSAAPPTPPPSAAAAPASAAGEHVDGAAAKKLVQGGARLVDVRSPEEYTAGHIEGATNVPVDTVEGKDLGAKDQAIVVYCASGKRSGRAAATLRAKGYTNVHDMGPMSAWTP